MLYLQILDFTGYGHNSEIIAYCNRRRRWKTHPWVKSIILRSISSHLWR